MPKHRDRHQRGLRGRLAGPNPYAGRPVPLRRQVISKARFFTECVQDALTQVNEACPRALVGVDVGIEEVPTVQPAWAPNRVPLAAAVSNPDGPSQIVVFRRPIEHRAASRKGLRILVFRTIVEQLNGLTGIPIDELDPHGHADEDPDD